MSTIVDGVMKELADIKAFQAQRLEEGLKPLKEEVDRMAKALLAADSQMRNLLRERITRADDGRLRIPDGRFAGWGLFELRALEYLLNARKRADKPSYPWMLEEIGRGRDAIRKAISIDAILGWGDVQLKRVGYKADNPFALLPMRRFVSEMTRQMVAEHVKALDSTTAAKGDELVPTFEAAELWMDVNLDTLILPLLEQVPMPTNPFDIPEQFGDTNWYPITENVQALTTDVTTAKTTITAQGVKAGVPFSDELEEDSIVAFISTLRANLVRNAAEIIDDLLLNADQTAANGINSDGATISKTTAGKAHWLLGWDGMIHLPLVDNTAQRSDLNAALAATSYNTALSKLARYSVPRRRGEVVFISDIRTHIKALTLDEVETVDKAGGRATLSTGELSVMYGIPYIRSEQMLVADTDGKVTSAGNGTDTGRILAVNLSQWKAGFRRQIELETDREPGKGQTTLYVSFRIALAARGTRSSATHTALVYDITGI